MATTDQAQSRPAPAVTKQPAPPAEEPTGPVRFTDGKVRIYLYPLGEAEVELASAYLTKYADDFDPCPPGQDEIEWLEAQSGKPITVIKTNEVRLDSLRSTDIIIPILRNTNRDKRRFERVGDEVRILEDKAPVVEGMPIPVARFATRELDSGGRQLRDVIDYNALVNAVGQACVVGRHALASPRKQRRGDGEGNHVFWLVLTH